MCPILEKNFDLRDYMTSKIINQSLVEATSCKGTMAGIR